MEFESFRCNILIKEHHIDTFGHVNNAVYLELFEEARWDYISPRGFSVRDIQKMGLGPTILEWNIKFKKEIRLRETITIESKGLSYERVIGKLSQNILNAKGELCCEAVMTLGLFDVRERKLVPPTPQWLYAIGANVPDPRGALV